MADGRGFHCLRGKRVRGKILPCHGRTWVLFADVRNRKEDYRFSLCRWTFGGNASVVGLVVRDITNQYHGHDADILLHRRNGQLLLLVQGREEVGNPSVLCVHGDGGTHERADWCRTSRRNCANPSHHNEAVQENRAVILTVSNNTILRDSLAVLHRGMQTKSRLLSVLLHT